MWGGGKKRPRSTVGETRILDRGHVQCAQLKFHTPGLPNYERVSIALALFYGGKDAGAHQSRTGGQMISARRAQLNTWGVWGPGTWAEHSICGVGGRGGPGELKRTKYYSTGAMCSVHS